jgi:hypothetical protein
MINIKSIWESQKPTGDIIIKTKINDIPHLNCYAATNHITGQHLYIMSLSKKMEIPELRNYRFKGVEIFLLELESSSELNIYLIDISLKDIFSLFIQNIVEDILESTTENEALTKTLNIISKWKKLFDKISFNGLTIEQQKGLTGELLFINFLLDSQKTASKILHAWSGPDFEDKDFVFGATGLEIKLTSSKNPTLKITSERQLDIQNLDILFLVLYTVNDVKENGFTLTSLIDQTRQRIGDNLHNLKLFNDKLISLGILDDDLHNYDKMYSLKNIFYFHVTSEFPKIVKSQVPWGIYNTSYSIELSAVEKFIIDSKEITQKV